MSWTTDTFLLERKVKEQSQEGEIRYRWVELVTVPGWALGVLALLSVTGMIAIVAGILGSLAD